MNNASAHKSSPYSVLEAAAIFSRMRDWGRGALPINKMDWLSWVSQLGYTQLCVVLGTVSLRGKKDGAGELQLWYRARFNDCRILYASRTAGHDEMVCELLMFSSFTSKNSLTKSAKSKRYQQRSRNYISSNTKNKWYYVRVD